MGDMNAKVGADNKGEEEIMGKHGMGEVNEERGSRHFVVSLLSISW